MPAATGCCERFSSPWCLSSRSPPPWRSTPRARTCAFAAEMRRKHGFDAVWLDAVLADATSQPRIIELMSKPAERSCRGSSTAITS